MGTLSRRVPSSDKWLRPSHLAREEQGKLSPRLKASTASVCARADCAYYAIDLVARRLNGLGLSDAEANELTADMCEIEGEQLVLAFARKLAAGRRT